MGWSSRLPRVPGRSTGVVIGGLLAALMASSAARAGTDRGAAVAAEAVEVPVFSSAAIFYSPDSTSHFSTPGVEVRENGRMAVREANLPDARGRRVTARITIHPAPKDERSVFDRWDRAGSIRLLREGEPDLELVRFITSYGGRTEHVVDLTALSARLQGRVRIGAFIDTWVAPAWRVDFTLHFVPDSTADAPSWVAPIYFTDSFNAQDQPSGAEAEVEVPAGMQRVVLRYLSTGHCTDGTDADEFISKANVISVDGVVVYRFHPWRDDCRAYRERNPYTTRWSDGNWSSDYRRSGWCPGTEVVPTEIDLTDHLTAGRHRVRIAIERMRPRDAQGNFGYWRVSAAALGWDHEPELWKN